MFHVRRYNIYTYTPSAAFIYTEHVCQIIRTGSYCRDIFTFCHLADAFIQSSISEGYK